MKQNNLLPVVMVEKRDKGVRAEAALRLKSILKQSLFARKGGVGQQADQESQGFIGPEYLERQLSRRRESFAGAMAGWPADTVLELRLVAQANLASWTRGAIEVFLLPRTAAKNEAEAKARLIFRFLQLTPLVLPSCRRRSLKLCKLKPCCDGRWFRSGRPTPRP